MSEKFAASHHRNKSTRANIHFSFFMYVSLFQGQKQNQNPALSVVDILYFSGSDKNSQLLVYLLTNQTHQVALTSRNHQVNYFHHHS